MQTLTREEIISEITKRLEPLEFVNAMWEAGAKAFNRVDEWSDIDLQIDVKDGFEERTFEIFEETLKSLSPIELRFVLPKPTWHGHEQAFYKLKNASEFLLIDFVLMTASNKSKFLEPEIHGKPNFLFDKNNTASCSNFDANSHKELISKRIETLKVTFPIYQALTTKELHRKNYIEALSYYQGMTLRPLVEVLRMKYEPNRYNFHTRYVYYEFPKEVVSRLEKFFFVGNGEELWQKHSEAGKWFYEILKEFKI